MKSGRQAPMVTGRVTGASGAAVGGGDFMATRTGPGQYNVRCFTNYPLNAVTITPQSGGVIVANMPSGGIQGGLFVVSTFNPQTAVNADCDFSFVATGLPR